MAERRPTDSLGRAKPLRSYVATWGTCMAIVEATSKAEAVGKIRARDESKVPGRFPLKVHVRRATATDLARWAMLTG